MKKHFLELIRRTSTTLPLDVRTALEGAVSKEPEGSPARAALGDILFNCEVAASSSRPICQDTGTNIWYVHLPENLSSLKVERDILAATREATKRAYLRPNAVDPITGKNSGDNVGLGAPVVHFHVWRRKYLVADLLLKGGGSENVSALYSLPHKETGAGRDLEGIRRVVVDAVFNAQGKGCAPGIIGVGVGGDRATSMLAAKEQLFRPLDDVHPDETIAHLEQTLFEECNQLSIGPMGFGGATTVLGVKIGTRHRLPASFFVAIAYLCWAGRRASVRIDGDKVTFSEACEMGKLDSKKGVS
jgi:fumarate hydratase, class I